MKEQAPPRTGEIGVQAESLQRRRHPARSPQPRVRLLAQPGSSLLSIDLSLPNKERRGLGKTAPSPAQRPVWLQLLFPDPRAAGLGDGDCKKCPSVQHPWGTLHTEAPS